MKALKFVSDGLSPGMAADEEVPVFAAPFHPDSQWLQLATPSVVVHSVRSALPTYPVPPTKMRAAPPRVKRTPSSDKALRGEAGRGGQRSGAILVPFSKMSAY